MPTWQNAFILTFIPLLIVMDTLGNLPVVISLTQGLSERERRKVIDVAMATAAIVGLVFLFFGQLVLGILGISVGSFAIAGGIILLVLSINYMTTGRFVEANKDDMMAVVPLGTPLVVGPATITTLLLLSTQYSIYLVLFSFALNLAIAWGVFRVGENVAKFLGVGGLKAVSKVFSLLLAAIAVSMIIRGMQLAGIIK